MWKAFARLTVLFSIVRAVNALDFTSKPIFDFPNPGGLCLVADLNGDRRNDIVMWPHVLVANTDSFTNIFSFPGNDVGGILADFNHDAILDAIHSQTVWLGNNNGTFRYFTNLQMNLHPYMLKAFCAYLNADSHLDLAVVPASDRTLEIWFGDGRGAFTPGNYTNSFAWRIGGLTTADFNQDGAVDIALVFTEAHTSNTVRILTGLGDGTFTNTTEYAPSTSIYDYSSIGSADLNADLYPDLIVFGQYGGLSVMLGQSGGGFGQPIRGGAGVYGGGFDDFNGDGNIDIVGSAGNIYFVPGRGDGTFGPRQLIPVATDDPAFRGPQGYGFGHLGVDRKPDILVTYLRAFEPYRLLLLSNVTAGSSAPPRLTIEQGVNHCIVRWPRLNTGFFALEESTNISDATAWKPTTNTIFAVSGEKLTTNQIDSAKFFRLVQ